MPSLKVVFFVPPDVEGCSIVKELFKNKYGMSSKEEENLVFDYISHEVDNTSLNLKLYLVPDLEKYEKIRPLCFTNVDVFVVMFDMGVRSVETWRKKICQDLKLHQSNSKMVFLAYIKDDAAPLDENFEFIRSCKGLYYEFSGLLDLDHKIEIMFEDLNELSTETTRTYRTAVSEFHVT